MFQGTGLAGLLSMVLIVFILQHTFFILTSLSSLEMHLLSDLNPFHEGHKKVEQQMYNDYIERLNEKKAQTMREKHMLMKRGVPANEITIERLP